MSGTDNYELPDRHAAQAEGTHPAPCARHCEANAYEIELRRLRAQLAERDKTILKQQAWLLAMRESFYGWAEQVRYESLGDLGAMMLEAEQFSNDFPVLEAHDREVRIKCLEDAAKQLDAFGKRLELDLDVANYLDCEAELRNMANEFKDQS